jgi:hypothetical protein
MSTEIPPSIDGLKTVTENVCSHAESALEGVRFENLSPTEPLVILRYFGPEANPDAPEIGDAAK